MACMGLKIAVDSMAAMVGSQILRTFLNNFFIKKRICGIYV